MEDKKFAISMEDLEAITGGLAPEMLAAMRPQLADIHCLEDVKAMFDRLGLALEDDKLAMLNRVLGGEDKLADFDNRDRII